ncbi:uncharacterized protein KY384_001923 [Bacidia gigantensis]|uniref:uncharacterized protein n=1 Tax=Bacidia gigantensis TaxID=2732470 RepID=UPI001D03DDE1|nr:uncharacterized protein KY384_001923 [Bacidia gigantensis]KAG8533140.1 hypothetical protein KY384_001923 [Bacidia gigantensis]
MQASSTLVCLRPTSILWSQAIRPVFHLRRPIRHQILAAQTRGFSNPLSPLQTLSASRILPYHANQIFNIIADITSYPAFIPFCTSSNITSLSSPDPTQKKQWPRTADLRIGYGPYDETFTSRVYCLPYTALEAVAGDAEPTISHDALPHYSIESTEEQSARTREGNSQTLFNSILTRWSFREFPFKPLPPDGSPQEGSAEANESVPRTEVSLHIEVRFASAVYGALSQAAAPKVAGMMIEAFEKRAKEVLGEGHGPQPGQG